MATTGHGERARAQVGGDSEDSRSREGAAPDGRTRQRETEPLRDADRRGGAERDPALQRRAPGSWVTALVGTTVIVAVLYVGRGVLIPLAIAILLTFLLSPLASRLQRLHVPRVPAVLLTALATFLVTGAIGLLIGAQVTQLAAELPSYQTNVILKLRSLSDAAPSGGVFERLSSMVDTLRAEVDAVTGDNAPAPETENVPVVEVRMPERSAFEVLTEYATPIIGPAGKAGLVVVLVIFMLLEREALRNRLIRLIGPNINVTTEALDETGSRVSRYLLMQLVVNVTYGIPFGIGLYFIGIPNSFLWAALAVLLRFIPYLGPLLSATFPLLLAIAVDPGWTTLLLTLGLILTIELVSNNFIEPWLYGASTSISAVAIILAAIFWTTLWGPIGLLLATPLTVCLAVTGRYFPQLAFLDVLLGSAPALSLPERFYQRLLAGDAAENIAIAESFLEEHDLPELYDEVALPALRLAAADNARGTLSPERRLVVTRTVLELVGELAEHDDSRHERAPAREAPEPDPQGAGIERADGTGSSVLCAAGRSGFDLAVATMLGQLLERQGFAVRVVSAEALSPEHLTALNVDEHDAICLSYLDETAAVRALQTARRLARHAPGKLVLLGMWNLPERDRARRTRLPEQARVVRTLGETLEVLLAEVASEHGFEAAPIPAEETERLQDLHGLAALNVNDERVARFTHRLAEAFGVPICALNLVDEDSQHFKGATGLPDPLAHAGKSPRETSICGHVVAENELLIVEDALSDPRFAENPFLLEHGIRFYAGAPLCSSRGHAIGSICVIDANPRKVTDEERALLRSVAAEAMAELESLAAEPAAAGDAPPKRGRPPRRDRTEADDARGASP